ncbi:sensor histidine kinase [Glutamicibacter sp. AOP5-A2-18]|uniref:sensor histidine kinase n=1 Tax=Glutamicibacter sp. AOP5-A2-18 TaxID=3457656 RepID=UPI0040331737
MNNSAGNAMDAEEQFWRRWGWMLSGVWLLFLIFPILQLLQNPYPSHVRITGLGLLVIFSFTYLRGFRKYSHLVGQGGTNEPEALLSFLLLAVLVVPAIFFIEVNALGLLPFITSFAAFLLTKRWVIATYAVAAALSIGLPIFLGQFSDGLFLIGLNLAMMVVYAVTVAAISRSVASEELRGDYLVMAEQERVARDVHDGIGHSLTALNLKAQLALRLIDAGQIDRARTEVQQLSTLALDALASVRTTVQGLERQDLDAELALLRKVCDDSGLSFTLVGNAEQIELRWRSHTAWIVREALTNVLRHAHAGAVRVTITAVEVTVDDDGDGLREQDTGHGIRGMVERAKQIGATATVGPSPFGGTRLQLIFASSIKEQQ